MSKEDIDFLDVSTSTRFKVLGIIGITIVIVVALFFGAVILVTLMFIVPIMILGYTIRRSWLSVKKAMRNESDAFDNMFTPRTRSFDTPRTRTIRKSGVARDELFKRRRLK